MTTRTKYKRIFLLSLVVCMGISMTGCRESDEIQNIILTADAEEQDETEEMNPDMEGVLDENAPLIKEDPDSRSALEDAEAALQEDAEQDRALQDKTYNPDADINASASDAGVGDNLSNAGNGDNLGTGDGVVDTTAGRNSTKSGKKSSSEDSSDSSGNQGDGDDGGNLSGRREGNLSDDPDARQVFDANGDQIYLPEHVTSVAATESLALIVQMLGGDGILCASNADFLDDSLAQTVFNDEGITEVETLWDGDGSSPMSDEAFERLLELYPDCCIGVSGETTFSESQIQTLKKNDIPYLVVPDCSSAYNIETAVQIIGEAIGDNSDNGGLNSAKLAEEYVSYEQDLVEEVIEKHGIFSYDSYNFYKGNEAYGNHDTVDNLVSGFYAGYISDWDDSAYCVLRNGSVTFVEQNGLAATRGGATTPLSYYMSIAGVASANSRLTTTNNLDGSTANLNDRYNWWKNGNLTIENPSKMYDQLYENGNAVGMKEFNKRFEYFISDYWDTSIFAVYAPGYQTSGTDVIYARLGDEKYPALIVTSKYIQSKMESSRDSQLGLYRPGDNNESPIGNEDSSLFYSYKMGNTYYSNTLISNYYDIYVNPKGVGSWTEGSVENVLESVWLSAVYYNGYTENEVKDEIKKFYSTFYRCDLSDNLVSDILEGPED